MLSSIKNILILAPHTDDGEFGCGGTIAKLIKEGKNVSYIAFSTAEESVRKEDEWHIGMGKLFVADYAHHYADHQYVDGRADPKGDHDRSGYVLVRLNNFFGGVRDELKSNVRNIDQGHGRDERPPPHRCEGLQVHGFNVGHPEY